MPFQRGISPKANEMTWLDFEHIYYDAAVLPISHNATDEVGGRKR